MIRSGHISPWVLYLSPKAKNLLGRLNSEQIVIVEDVLDPEHWQKQILRREDDVSFVRDILEAANL